MIYVTDDITTTADGTDTYHLVKAAGKYKYIKYFHKCLNFFDFYKVSCLI